MALLGGGGMGTPLRLRCHPFGRRQSGGSGEQASAKRRAIAVLTLVRPYPPWLGPDSASCFAIFGAGFGRRQRQRLDGGCFGDWGFRAGMNLDYEMGFARSK